jgi:hypothetical protein
VRFSTFALVLAVVLCCALPGLADNCDTVAGNLVANCNFAGGTYTATIPFLPNPPNSDPGVPDFWNADPDFIEGYIVAGTDTVETNPMTGTDYLSIGTGQFVPPLVELSQGLTDVSGVTYFGEIDESGGVDVVIDNAVVFSGGSFSFIGTGTDELTLAATGGPYDVFGVVVTPAPEPRATVFLPAALLMGLVWISTRRRVAVP